MENQENQSVKVKQSLSGLLSILMILAIILTIWFIVGIFNKIKEGRQIGRSETQSVIVVSGSGEVFAKPDLATADFSVLTESNQISSAMEENTAEMNSVIAALKNLGVEEKDLKTTAFQVNPRYAWPRNGGRMLVGYDVSQTLNVKIRELDKVGQIVQAAVSAGANQLGDLSFTIDNKEELIAQARQEAINKAKAEAEEIADQLDVKLARIASYNESSAPDYPPIAFRQSFDALQEKVAAVPQIETGENKIAVSVSITYEIN